MRCQIQLSIKKQYSGGKYRLVAYYKGTQHFISCKERKQNSLVTDENFR